MPTYRLADGTLDCDGTDLFTGLSPRLTIEEAPNGTFLYVAPDPAGKVASRLHIPLGRIAGLERWSALFRLRTFWMFPEAGGATDPLPRFEIQHLLVRRQDGRHVVVVPLVEGALRWSLEGRADGLWLVGETGDPHFAAGSGLAAYVACGDDPYTLWPVAAREVATRLGTQRRVERQVPAFTEHFGWCTWDAFYEAVDPAKVVSGLESWRAAGLSPRFLVLDDGWQETTVAATGEIRLSGLGTNAKFPGGLGSLVRRAKDEFGVDTVLAWHAVIGYWGGVDAQALPGYGVRDIGRRFAPGLYRDSPDFDDWWGHLVGVVAPEKAAEFYADCHARLATMGIDGVKVDNQAVLEGVCGGLGGRVAMYRAYKAGLEASVTANLPGGMMNCGSHASESWYLPGASVLTRTSTDFRPGRPETHGLHLYTNAQVCTWFGEFMLGDWDMFQSAHAMGAYHAASRALSGSPVYCSDAPGAHDTVLLRRLVCADGTVLRFANPGLPGRSCLLRNPTREAVPLTIVNRAAHGAAIGVFHALYHADSALRRPLRATLGLDEVPGLAPGRYILWRHAAARAEAVDATSRIAVEVAPDGFEVLSLAPVAHGRALLGLRDKFVPPLAIRTQTNTADTLVASFRDGGEALVWCERPPRSARLGATPITTAWDAESRLLTLAIPPGWSGEVTLSWAD